ncbi:MAG TPA: cysteine hydrolase family protein [Reyranella sp.]
MTDALIVIDMQQGSFGPETPRHDAAGLVTRLNRLARQIRTDGGAVIFIQHDGPPSDPHHPDEPGWRLLPTLEIKPDDTVVHKTACDAFLHTTLDKVLRESGIDRLIITGCATDYCVDTTVRSALARGWPTIVPSDGHTTVDRPHLSATQIIAHHNAIWADFLAPRGPARVCLCTEVVLST